MYPKPTVVPPVRFALAVLALATLACADRTDSPLELDPAFSGGIDAASDCDPILDPTCEITHLEPGTPEYQMVYDAIQTTTCSWKRTTLLNMLSSGAIGTWESTSSVNGDYHDWNWYLHGHGDHIHLDTGLFGNPIGLGWVVRHELGHRSGANDGTTTMSGYESNAPCEAM